MQTQNKTFNYPAEYINKLRGIFYIMVGLPLPVFLVVYLTLRDGTYSPPLQEWTPAWLLWGISILCLVLCAVGYIQFSKETKKIRGLKAPIQEQLDQLISASRNKFLCLELATIINLIVYVLLGHTLFAGLYVAMLILFSMSNPTVHSVSTDLRLPKEEKRKLINNQPFQ